MELESPYFISISKRCEQLCYFPKTSRKGSMKLTIKQSKIGCYQIVEYQDKKFIMDLSTLKPKFYYWGFLPKTVMLEMIEIEKSNSQFELDNEKKMSFSTAVITIMVQPFVKIGYDLFKNVFVNYDINSQIVIKIILFLLSIGIAYLIVLHSLRRAHSKARILFDKNSSDYNIIFHSSNRRNPVNSIIFLGNIIFSLSTSILMMELKQDF